MTQLLAKTLASAMEEIDSDQIVLLLNTIET